MQTIYRVMTPDELSSEAEKFFNLPGGNCSYTGFWTTSKECAENIMDARINMAWETSNGGTRSIIVATTIDNVVVDNSLIDQKKTGHDDRYDKNEIFVTEIVDESKIVKIK